MHLQPSQNSTIGDPKSLANLINSFANLHAKSAQYKSAYNYQNKDEFDDDDDVIISSSHLKKQPKATATTATKKSVNNAATSTDSDYDKKYFRSLESQNDDGDSTQNAFENDSLSNTVIFVKNASANNSISQTQAKNESKNNSSGSSILGVQAYHQKCENDSNTVIGDEVKHLISKIITSIKIADTYTDDEEFVEGECDEESEDCKKISKADCKNAICDTDYLSEIIVKVLNVLRGMNKYADYLKLYQNQLTSYLKEALHKYQNKRLVLVMEDILIEISDILCNELTFYSIMNKNRLLKSEATATETNVCCVSTSKLINDQSLSECEKNGKSDANLNLVKSLARGSHKKATNSKLNEKNVNFLLLE